MHGERSAFLAWHEKCHTWYVPGMHCLCEIRTICPKGTNERLYLYRHYQGNLLARPVLTSWENYLVTVCHYSDWIETDELENTLSSTVVNATIKASFPKIRRTWSLPHRQRTTDHQQGVSGFCERLDGFKRTHHHHINHKEMGELRPQWKSSPTS